MTVTQRFKAIACLCKGIFDLQKETFFRYLEKPKNCQTLSLSRLIRLIPCPNSAVAKFRKIEILNFDILSGKRLFMNKMIQ